MKTDIKASAAFYTETGIIADTPEKPAVAKYRKDIGKNTYKLYISSKYRPAGVAAQIPVYPNINDTVFMNGFQSATESREMSITGKMNGLSETLSSYLKRKYAAFSGGDYDFARYSKKPGIMHGFSYCYFRSGDKIRLFASLDESLGYTIFRFDAWACTLRVSRDIKGVKRFDDRPAISLFYAEGEENEVFDLWFKALGEREMPFAEKLVGYSTAGKEISEDSLCENLEAMKKFPVKPNVFIIDSKYCANGDWLSPDADKFPIGLKEFAQYAHERELLAGISVSPFTAEEKSDVVRLHKNWLITDCDGKYLKIKNNLYVLDFCKPEVREYIRGVLHTILFMWGYDLIKLNNLYAAALIPSEGLSRGGKMCAAMRFLRECCGGKLLYADNVPLMPAFGLADYCRISCEAVSDNMPVFMRGRIFRESASVRNAASDIVFRRTLDNRAFVNVPCPVSLDEKEFMTDRKLSDSEQNLLITLEGLFTSVHIITDDVTLYNQRKKRQIKKMCSLDGATDVKVINSSERYIAGYKLGDKSYLIKF